MAFTEIYVDPSIATDSGAGTVGDPYGDLEYAIEQETFDVTNGTRVNIKAGTDEVLAADLSTALADTSVSVAWAPTATAPLVFQGYTTTAGDGGVGGISGGGSVGVLVSTNQDDVHFVDLHLHNTGANSIIDLDDRCSVIRCELDNSTGSAAVLIDNSGVVSQCYIHNISGNGVEVLTSRVEGCYISTGATGGGNIGISMLVSGGVAERNIIICNGAATGIYIQNDGISVNNNSIYADAGTGNGILAGINHNILSVRNNIIEGFSGTGGDGINLSASGETIFYYGGNAVYNCATAYSVTALIINNLGDNETLTASPFTDAANGNFSPVDTGNVKEGSLPTTIGGGLV